MILSWDRVYHIDGGSVKYAKGNSPREKRACAEKKKNRKAAEEEVLRPCATPMNAEQRVLQLGGYSPRLALPIFRATRSFFAKIGHPPTGLRGELDSWGMRCCARSPVERVANAALDTAAAVCYNGGRWAVTALPTGTTAL